MAPLVLSKTKLNVVSQRIATTRICSPPPNKPSMKVGQAFNAKQVSL
jgi:hypothetical protein